MIKIFRICFLCVVVLLFASCAGLANDVKLGDMGSTLTITNNGNTEKDDTELSDIPETETYDQQSEVENVEIPLMTFESLDELDAFLKMNKIPRNFVTYDVISDMGEFISFVFLSDAQSGDYSHGFYSLRDKSGMEIGVYVQFLNDTYVSAEDQIFEVPTPMDLRTSETNGSKLGVYVVDQISYTYISGLLSSIKWEIDNIQFTILFNSSIVDIQLNEMNDCLANLLNAQTASKCVDNLAERIDLADESILK
ncbi:MAG: hypothetical protein IJY39_04655 [Clostridia bacterium]|nr:hypothetical protein [Clostridia bacterium]